MSLTSRVQWTQKNYGMRDLMEKYRDFLPVLCKTTVGFDGGDEDINQIGADEVYWIYGIHKQTRLVCKTTGGATGVYVSIPTDYHIKLETTNNRGQKQLITVDDAVNKLQAEGGGYRVTFDGNPRLSYNEGGEGGNTASFGEMEVMDVYRQKYWMANPIIGLSINQATISLPVYMEIMFVVAEGFQQSTNDSEFTTWFHAVKQVQETFKRRPAKTYKQLIVFSSCPSSNDDYEYIRPYAGLDSLTQLLGGGGGGGGSSRSQLRGFKAQTNDYEAIPGERSTSGRRNDSSSSSRTDANACVSIPALPPLSVSEQSTSQIPRKPLVPVHGKPTSPSTWTARQTTSKPTLPAGLLDKITSSALHQDLPARGQKPPQRAPPPVPPSASPFGKKPPLAVPVDGQKPQRKSTSLQSVDEGETSRRKFHWTSAAYVPKDVDIGSWSTHDVVDCLRLLRIDDSKAQNFRQELVDGGLLLTMDEAMMVEQFSLNGFEARKVVNFVRNQWRPTIEK